MFTYRSPQLDGGYISLSYFQLPLQSTCYGNRGLPWLLCISVRTSESYRIILRDAGQAHNRLQTFQMILHPPETVTE